MLAGPAASNMDLTITDDPIQAGERLLPSRMHTRAPCTRPPARVSPTLALGRFRPGLHIVRQCGHAESTPAQPQDRGSGRREVSLRVQLYPFAARRLICAVSACSHVLALGVVLTITTDFALAGARYGRRSTCHRGWHRTVFEPPGELGHFALFLHAARSRRTPTRSCSRSTRRRRDRCCSRRHPTSTATLPMSQWQRLLVLVRQPRMTWVRTVRACSARPATDRARPSSRSHVWHSELSACVFSIAVAVPPHGPQGSRASGRASMPMGLDDGTQRDTEVMYDSPKDLVDAVRGNLPFDSAETDKQSNAADVPMTEAAQSAGAAGAPAEPATNEPSANGARLQRSSRLASNPSVLVQPHLAQRSERARFLIATHGSAPRAPALFTCPFDFGPYTFIRTLMA